MSSPTVTSSSARRRTFGGTQEPGLAEWTSKIRQMQQEVDEDVESEQKRLAEEIARSRMERTKRRGTGTYVLSPDLAQDVGSDSDDMRSIVDKQKSQSDAFRKLVGGGGGDDAASASSRATPPPSDRAAPISLAQFMGGRATGPRLNKHAPQQDAVDYTAYEQPRGGVHPVFGSRALSPTGSDELSVSQRAKQRGDAGVALPGLASSRSTTPAASSRPYTPVRSPDVVTPSSRTPEPTFRVASPSYEPRSMSPLARSEPARKSYTPEPTARAVSPAGHVGNASSSVYTPRSSTPLATQTFAISHTPEPVTSPKRKSFTPERAVSPPPPASRSRATTPSAASHSKPSSPSPRATSPIGRQQTGPKSRPTTPHARTETKSPTSSRPFTPKSQSAPAPITTPSSNQFRSGAMSRPHPSPGTPQRPMTSTTTTPKSSPQAVHTPSFLARPLPPGSVRPAQQIIPPTKAMSPAFLKPAKEKDLTPSLSRLQGRGFVEQRIKAASKLQDGALFKPSSPVSEHGERKKSSLVDIWAKREEELKNPPSPSTPKMVGKIATPFAKAQQQAPVSPSPASKPAPSPAPVTVARPDLAPIAPLKPTPPPATAKPVVSRPLPIPTPAVAQAPIIAPTPTKPPAPAPASVSEKSLGSSHTMISFARPAGSESKTGDGQKMSLPAGGGASGLERQPSDSTPLTHLTRDRPKKRGKASSTPAPAAAAPVRQSQIGDGASDFDSVRVRSELIRQFPAPPSTGADELGRRQAFHEAPPEDEPPPDGETRTGAVTQHSDDAKMSTDDDDGASTRPPSSVFAAGVEAWADRAPIGVGGPLPKKNSNGDMGMGIGLGIPPVVSRGQGRALPGLTGGGSPFSSGGSSTGAGSGADDTSSNITERPLDRGKHPRIPSTGTRATVMDVAQALKERHERESSATSTTSATSDPEQVDTQPAPTAVAPELERETTPRADETSQEEEEEAPRVDVRAAAAMWGKQSSSSDSESSTLGAPRRQDTNGRISPQRTPEPEQKPLAPAVVEQPPPSPEPVPVPAVAPAPMPAPISAPSSYTAPIPRARPPANMERRRSTYERYSSIILPPLQEETTPVNSPQASLSRAHTNGVSPVPPEPEPEDEGVAIQEVITKLDASPAEEIPAPESVPPFEDVPEPEERIIQLDHDDGLLPPFNLNAIHASATTFQPDESIQPLSVEVFIISGSTSTPARKPEHVFYETETIAVVYRAKDQKSGLVSSKVWAWRGREAAAGEREEQKLAELAKRFGTGLIDCPQGSESLELLHVLGGVLIVRQGPRAHWTAENTAMHRVRTVGNAVFIEQLDLAISNLCSGYSYCLSILGALYVWHGRGSPEAERQQALTYANTMLLAEGMEEVTELSEGAEDEMFWAILGDEPYANAEYWQWRLDLPHVAPRMFRIDSSRGKDAVKHIPNFAAREIASDGVYVVDGVFELFVLVGAQARGKRTDIRLALYIAENISMAVARHRPFDPVIHALVMPSLWPLDLKALFRDFDEAAHNEGTEPEHMNVIAYEEAHDHMSRHEWPSSQLSDLHFLPLGVSPDMLT
ncbi:hypothetical protein EXIGLDRAFT_729858 [Exidia glandulosa HHB12029]|uniref:DUF7904 domain-containing protein n=1 Tax=Exidia glandulosa HHB12029 TaxID=1314781 RepID=A0A165LE39_EXIGL|nr:hypothetical protein EXIGLDRAFT_729858 [Exidia glandulosa HHB12029]